MKSIVIFGTDSWAKTITYYILNNTDVQIVAYTADKSYITSNEYLNKPVVSFENIEEYYPPNMFDMFMGIGYSKMNSIREIKFNTAKQKGYAFPNIIHPTAIINNSQIGEGNMFMEYAVIEPFTVIGNNNVFFTKCGIGHDSVIGNHNFFSISALIAGNVIVRDKCFIGIGATIQNGIKLENSTLVGGGAYVHKSTNENDVVVPARSVVLENKKSTDFI